MSPKTPNPVSTAGAKPTLVPKLRFPEFRGAEDWTSKALGELFSDRQESGHTGLPLLSLMDKEGIVPQEDSNRKNNSNIDKSQYLRVVPGDIAYNTMRMWEGRSALVGLEGLVSPAYTVCKPQPGVHSLLFSYYFRTPQLIVQFRRFSQGLVKDTLNLKFPAFAQISVPVPTYREQQKIADCLSSLDELIAAQARKVEALKIHKKGLMQQLFPREGEAQPRLRLLEFQDAGEWKRQSLEQLSETISSGRDKSAQDGAFDLYGSTGIIGKTNRFSFSGKYILVARVGANAGLLTRATGKFGVTDNTLVIVLKPLQHIDFVFFYLDQIGLNKMIFGSGQPLITGGQLKAINIQLPNKEEQQRIASCLSSLDTLIVAATKELDSLKAHKQGLMQQLFPSAEEAAT